MLYRFALPDTGFEQVIGRQLTGAHAKLMYLKMWALFMTYRFSSFDTG